MAKDWHLNKSIPVGMMLSLAVLLLSQVYAYGQNQQKLEQVNFASTSHVTKSELNQKLENLEYKMQHAAEDAKEANQGVKENQKMIIELLQRIPKRG